MDWIDISVPLNNDQTMFRGDPPFQIEHQAPGVADGSCCSAWEWAPDDSLILGTPTDSSGAFRNQVRLGPGDVADRSLAQRQWVPHRSGSALTVSQMRLGSPRRAWADGRSGRQSTCRSSDRGLVSGELDAARLQA